MSDNQCENSSLPDSQREKQRKPRGGNVDPDPKYYNCTIATISVQKKLYKTLVKVECSHIMQFYLLSEVETPCVRNNNTYVRNYNLLPVTVSWYLNVLERYEKSR